MTQSELPFVIDAEGVFPPGRVFARFVDTPRPSTPALEMLISEVWERETARAAGTDKLLFNGPLLRYLDHRVEPSDDGGAFHLTVGPTCYRDFVGTNLYNHHRLGEFDWKTFANPIGTTATLMTCDGRICYGRRSARVSYHAEHVHTFGGAFEERDKDADGTIDPFGTLTRELTEELALEPEELFDLVCVGLIRDKEIHQPELLFEARLEMTADELVERWRSAESRDEHDELVTLADAPGAIVPFIESCGPIAPVAVGGLFLHGRRMWGEEWFEAAAREYGC